MLSKRCQNINTSGIRKVFELARTLKNPIDFSIGLPDFDTFAPIKAEAIKHIECGQNKYTLSQGIPELRELLKHHYLNKQYRFEDVMITSGVSGGILLSLMALLDPGDEVIVPDPYFVMYRELPGLISANPVLLDTYDTGFMVSPERLKAAISPRTKMLFLNSPANPTGKIMTHEDCEAIALALKGTDIWVVADDIYDSFDYDHKHVPFSRYYEKTITLGGFSKSHAMTGWRMGYAFGPSQIIEGMTKLQQYTFVCAPSFAQYACLKAFDLDFEPVRLSYREKRDLVVKTLSPHFDLVFPDGAFYCFLKHPQLTGTRFVHEALKHRVIMVPGNVFSSRDSHFRISFARSLPVLKEGLDILSHLAGQVCE